MGKALIVLGAFFSFVSIIFLYIILGLWLVDADYWWQKLLGIIAIITLPIVLMIVGAMIC